MLAMDLYAKNSKECGQPRIALGNKDSSPLAADCGLGSFPSARRTSLAAKIYETLPKYLQCRILAITMDRRFS
jgi:hypothetical protein